jgi:hypothetical protein
VEPGFFPLDEELALLPGALSPPVQEAVVLLGAALPFRQAGQVLARVGRITVSPSTVRRVTERAGAALVAVEDAAVDQIERRWPDAPPGPVRQQVSVDGAMVPVLHGDWKEAKTLVVGALAAATPAKAQGLSYYSSSRGFEHFLRLATGELHRRGTFAAAEVVGVVDGAVWCQSFFDYHLPGAVRILDFPHAVERLNEAAQAVFGPGTADGQTWLEAQRTQLRHGDPQVVIEAVAALAVDQAADPAGAATVRDKLQGYLQTRLPQLAYAAFAEQGWPIGSGIVESGNKVVVEARLKGAGMHWHADAVDAMLALRCAVASQRWAEVWPQLSQQRRHAARRTAPRPATPPTPPAAAPVPLAPQPHRSPAPRIKTIVNGKPTKDHPWKRSFLPQPRPTPTIPQT